MTHAASKIFTPADIGLAVFLLGGLLITDLTNRQVPVSPDACTRDGVVPPLHQTAIPSSPEAADPARVQRVTSSPASAGGVQ